MKRLTYEQAFVKCLDISSAQAEKAYDLLQKSKSPIAKLMADEAMNTYQAQGALMLRLPKNKFVERSKNSKE